MKTSTKFLAGLLAVAVLSTASDAFAFDIAKDGKPVAVIATGANPAKTTVFAANELAKYLGNILGAPFTVVNDEPPASGNCILVGSPYSGKNDEICLRFKDKRILELTGQQPRGPLYAVYELLEKLGCGFWSNDNESWPSMKDITIPDDYEHIYAPPFLLRSNSGTTSVYNPKWRPKARLNNCPFPEMGGTYKVDMSESSLGLNHGKLAQEYFATNPEWYSFVTPKGSKKKQRDPGQICFTNPGALDKLAELALERLKENPDLEYLSCSYADARPACECGPCSALARREGSKAAILLNGVNYVARAVREEYPNVKITFLAYGMNSLFPPKNMKLEPNVACIFAHLARDYSKPPAYTNKINRWNALTGTNVFIWGYGAMFHNYLMPTPTVDLFGAEMRFYRDLGCKGVSSQLSQSSLSDCIDLVCWLFGKMAWNPDYDEWEMIDRWCDGALGKGSPYIKKWLRMERDYRPNIKYLGPYEKDNRRCLSPELLMQGYDLFKEALEAAKDDPRCFKQLEKMYGSIISVMVSRYNFDIAQLAKEQGRENFPSRDDFFAELERLCDEYKGSWLGEHQGSIIGRLRNAEILRHNGKIPPWTFANPVSATPVQDPFITYDEKTGYYYLLYTTRDQIEIRRGKTASKLADSTERVVAWRPKKTDKSINGNLAAPELHKGDDGKWYIYATGSDGLTLATGAIADDGFGDMGLDESELNILMDDASSLKGDKSFTDLTEISENRIFVLQSQTEDPFGKYDFKGILDKKVSALDPTIFRAPDGNLYMAYSQQGEGVSIMMVKMKDYMTIDRTKPPVSIVTSHNQAQLFEAPTVLNLPTGLFLIYSIHGRWSNDCTLQIRKFAGKDILRNSSWGNPRSAKTFLDGTSDKNPLGCKSVSEDKYARAFGAGHASFFKSPNGKELWCAYHAMQRPNSGTGIADVYMYQQRVRILSDGRPHIGGAEVDSRIKPGSFLIRPAGETWVDNTVKKAPPKVVEKPKGAETKQPEVKSIELEGSGDFPAPELIN